MKVTFRQKGSFKNTERFLRNAKRAEYWSRLEKYGQEGVEALASATPADTGKTAESWSYEIKKTDNGYAIYWFNTNVQDGSFNVAIGLQYGHATGTGGWVEGFDYINPAIRPIFDRIAEDVWRGVAIS